MSIKRPAVGSSLPHYIGITGIQDPSDVKALAALAQRYSCGPDASHILMLGCLVSRSTVRDATPTNTLRPDRHVASFSQLVDVLTQTREYGTLGMLHMELHKSWPGVPSDAYDVISLLQNLSKHTLSPPIQLNGILLPDDIKKIRSECGVPIVLQMRKELSHRGEFEVLRYLEGLVGTIDTILFDPSAGTGEVISLEPITSLVNAITSQFPAQFSFGFAGGLGAVTEAQSHNTTALVTQLCLALRSKDFSVDVETNVRIPGRAPHTDVLCLNLCEKYLAAVHLGLSAASS